MGQAGHCLVSPLVQLKMVGSYPEEVTGVQV